jgi:hypothetical protein
MAAADNDLQFSPRIANHVRNSEIEFLDHEAATRALGTATDRG